MFVQRPASGIRLRIRYSGKGSPSGPALCCGDDSDTSGDASATNTFYHELFFKKMWMYLYVLHP